MPGGVSQGPFLPPAGDAPVHEPRLAGQAHIRANAEALHHPWTKTLLRQAVQEYVRMRRDLGFKLHEAGKGLLDFVTFMEQHRASVITQVLALAWAQQPSNVQPAHWAPHTIRSYRDSFRQFLKFVQQRLHTPPSRLAFQEIDAPLIVAFLESLEKQYGVSVRSRNLRLTAIHSFFRYAAFEAPAHAAQIQRVLAIPSKRFTRTLVQFLTRPEVDALLAAPDQRTWSGRRDHAFLLVAVQTGLRLSEMTGLTRADLVVGAGAHVRVIGNGNRRRRRSTCRCTTSRPGWRGRRSRTASTTWRATRPG